MLRSLRWSVSVIFILAAMISRAQSADGQPEDSREQISSVRAQLDQAFLQRSFADRTRLMTDEVTTTGPNWHERGRSSTEKAERDLVRRRPDVTWVHTPQDIVVNEPWSVASESGIWYERWRAPDGLIQIDGRYLALWKRENGAWLLHAELFVPHSCRGGSYCDPD
jgi:hypothetical protein